MSSIVLRTLGAVWAGYTAYLYFDSSLFSYHPVMLAAGYGAVMTSAIVTAKTARTLPPKEKENMVQMHQLAQWVAFLFNLAGVGAIVANKIKNDRPHFASYHSWVGGLAIFFSFWALGNGWVASLKPEELPGALKNFMEENKGGVTKGLRGFLLVHRAVGALAYIFGVWAALLGFQKYHLGTPTYVLQAGLIAIAIGLLIDGFAQGRYNPKNLLLALQTEKKGASGIGDGTKDN
eukprot:comp12627_c1_seq1/m.7670 comp12627_c1_seq1/g.7670  ORF comp12627_c1_seq1/g.7670 comp12627_c1_seq1/m.7670 type:complete len:234 (-) comp12627_c1_seq1:132-833(-)